MIKIRLLTVIKEIAASSWIIVVLAMTCCTGKSYQIQYRNRIAPGSDESRLDSIYRDSVIVFFEQGFSNTPVEIHLDGNVIYDRVISTSSAITLADVANVGYRDEIEQFKIRLFEGEYFVVKISKPYKYAALNYDGKTVYVDYLEYYPMYE